VETNGGFEAVEVNSEMPAGEILPELVGPHETDFSAKCFSGNKIRMVWIKERLATNGSPVSKIIQ